MKTKIKFAVVLSVLLLASPYVIQAAPPPTGTVITLAPWRLKTIGTWAQAKTWLNNRSLTIASVSGSGTDLGRPPGGVSWSRTEGLLSHEVTITLNETLTTEQKTDLHDALIAATDGVKVE